MKRIAFILSLFTPIIFVTDSFATDCPNLMTSIGASEAGEDYAYWSNNSEDASDNVDTYGISRAGEFVVDYGNKGKVHGYARCSTRSVTNPWYYNSNTFESDHFTETLPDSVGEYCYCRLDGYTPNDEPTIALSAPYVFLQDADHEDADICAAQCSAYCVLHLQDGDPFYLAFRTAVFNSVSCESETPATPVRSPLRVAAATHNASENALVSAAYARGAYNANVANINNAIEYMEDSSVATINSAKVSADNVSLSVNGFTPSGTVSVNSSNATVSGTFNVPTTVALMDSWGSNTTTNATLGGIQQANITNGGISGLSATFTGTASGNLSGTGSFSNASVHVDGWKPVNPQ